MNTRIENLFNKVKQLPEEQQEEFAYQWEKDLESEKEFDKKLHDTADKLKILADEALKEHKEGKTQRMGFDEL